MRLRTALFTCILLLTLGLIAQAGSVPDLVSHQGRLLKADGTPETGVHSLTFKIYEASSGGVALWTEPHPSVSLDEGLFTVLLGSTVPMGADLFSPPSSGSPVERWLEVAVDGQVLSPRLRFGSVPYSSSSRRMDGDVTTSPSTIQFHGMSGSTTGTIRATDDSAGFKFGAISGAHRDDKVTFEEAVSILDVDTDGDGKPTNQCRVRAFTDGSTMDLTSDPDEDGTPNGKVTVKSSQIGSATLIMGGHSGSTTGTIRMVATPDSTIETTDCDDDDDGFSESQARIRLTPIDAEMGISADRFANGPRQSVSLDGSFSHARTTVLSDFDHDGHPDLVAMRQTDSSGIRDYLDDDTDDDGVSDFSVHTTVNDDSASLRLNGLPPGEPVIGTLSLTATGDGSRQILQSRSGSTTGTIRMAAAPGELTDYRDMDDDDDGVPEVSETSSITSDMDYRGIQARSGSTTATIRMMATPDSTVHEDSAGNAGGYGYHRGMNSNVRSTALLGVDRGLRSSSSSQTCDTAGAQCALLGRSGSTTGTIRMAASPSLVEHHWYTDADDDGVADFSTETTVTNDSATLRLNGLPPGEPVIGTLSLTATGDGSRQVLLGRSGSTTGTIRMAAAGSGGGGGGIGSAASMDIEVDSDDDGVPESSSRTWTDSHGAIHTMSGSTTGTIRMAVSDTGAGSTLTIGSVATTHFIDVEGGAYCNGTNWVNASDVNSKENFKRVDGEKLLDQIADLKITRWNYKGQEGVEHIGPTAQDFQKIFGVGEDDKSISTIDPSGIALAAIKELQKQNHDLKNENADLREALEALARKVDAMAATR